MLIPIKNHAQTTNYIQTMFKPSSNQSKTVLKPSSNHILYWNHASLWPPWTVVVGSAIPSSLVGVLRAMMRSTDGALKVHSPVADLSSTMRGTPAWPEPVRQTTLLLGRRRDPPKLVKRWRVIMVLSVLVARRIGELGGRWHVHCPCGGVPNSSAEIFSNHTSIGSIVLAPKSWYHRQNVLAIYNCLLAGDRRRRTNTLPTWNLSAVRLYASIVCSQ